MANEAKHIKVRRWALGCLAVVVLAIGGAWIWHASAGKSTPAQPNAASGPSQPQGTRRGGSGPNRAIPVQVAKVSKGPVRIYLGALGTVTPPNSVLVRSRVDGQLLNMSVHEGDLVKAGQLIAQIDPRSYQVQVAQAEGQLAKDQAQLTSARQQLARFQTLLSQDSISKQQVETQDALVKQYEGTVKSDQASLDNARLQLSYCRITAPVSGRLGLRQIDPGNMVHSSDSTGLFIINQIQPIDVAFTIPEAQFQGIMKSWRAGKELGVDAWDREQKNLLASGKVLSFDNQIDTTTGTIKFKARFANEDMALFPNQFVNIKLLARTLDDMTLAPSAAIQRGRDGAFVYVVGADNTVSQRKVQLGVESGNQIAVEEGLKPGEQVVVDGIDQLRDGAQIEISDASSLLKPSGPRGENRRGRGGAKGDAASAQPPVGDASAPAGGRRHRAEQ